MEPLPIKAAFLDRDGTIIVEKNYLKDPDGVVLLPGVITGLKALMARGYRLFVVSNQSGVGRGIISAEELKAVQTRFAGEMEKAGVTIETYLYCLHAPDVSCPCRKPGTGLIPREWQGSAIDFTQSLVVGDKLSDLQLAEALGAKGVLVLTGYGMETQKVLAGSTPQILPSLAEI